jgi:hypothetical protein
MGLAGRRDGIFVRGTRPAASNFQRFCVHIVAAVTPSALCGSTRHAQIACGLATLERSGNFA